MALTKAEKRAAAEAGMWEWSQSWGILLEGEARSGEVGMPSTIWTPEGAVAKLRDVPFGILIRGGWFPGYPGEPETLETRFLAAEAAHRALKDVAKYLGYRDRTDLLAEIQYLEGLRLDATALKERFIGLVAGQPRSSLPKLPRPGGVRVGSVLRLWARPRPLREGGRLALEPPRSCSRGA